MKIQPKVLAHGSYIGVGGYNQHTRDFFRHLSKLVPTSVRNFTIGESWNGLSNEPHNNEDYINPTDKKILKLQSLWNEGDKLTSYPIYKKYKNEFKYNVNIILNETNHHYFYENYDGPKIAYNVWESTHYKDKFFQQLLKFDQIWVPSKWQAKHIIKQGADSNKVKVVPEGVDVKTFYPQEVSHKDYDDGRFKFVIFGRWDYRKSTKEIIDSFLNTFSKDEPVDLIVSIDNPWSNDGVKTTEERLKLNGFDDSRIKVKHFPTREDYIKYLKKGHIFLSCARSEGWNLPLIEAMACGTPSIYSEDSGQMEFAEGKGLPVKIKSYELANTPTNMQFANNSPGYFPEPDFNDLSIVMRDAYVNYKQHKIKALKDSKLIHKEFNWDAVAEIGKSTLTDFINTYIPPPTKNNIIIKYSPKPKVEIIGDNNKSYSVEFYDGSDLIFKDEITNGMWSSIQPQPSNINLSIKINEI